MIRPRMLGEILDFVIVAAAVLFYFATVYHIGLILIGLRMAKGGRRRFAKGFLRNPWIF